MMLRYLRLLSRRQILWAVGGLLVAAAFVAGGLLTRGRPKAPDLASFTTGQSLRQVAQQLGATGKAVARELELPLDVSKAVPLADLGVDDARLHATARHLLGHGGSGLKYWLYAALVAWGWIYLARIGRPERGAIKDRRKIWYPRILYTLPLVLAVAIAGFLLGKSPNPMEGAVKVFKSMVGLYPDVGAKVLACLFFLGLAIVGNKLICGWGCPFGALQELLHSIPWLAKLKRRIRPPFPIMNLVRGGLFVMALLVLFGTIGGRKGWVLYHDLNPFNLFDLELESVSILMTIAASLLVGLVVYRPFCHLICPFGFLSWLVERVSVYRVRIDRGLCNECGACVRACPSSAAAGILKRDPLRADCFSCGACLKVCPSDAIRYESVFRSPSPSRECP